MFVVLVVTAVADNITQMFMDEMPSEPQTRRRAMTDCLQLVFTKTPGLPNVCYRSPTSCGAIDIHC